MTEANNVILGLSLVCISGSKCSGNNTNLTSLLTTTTSGIATFINVKILSSGSFNIIISIIGVKSLAIPPGNSAVLNITNNIQNITATSISTISTYFNFNILINIYGDDGNLFIQGTSIIASSPDKSLLGNTTGYTSSGNLTISPYFSNNSSQSISIIAQSPNFFNYT